MQEDTNRPLMTSRRNRRRSAPPPIAFIGFLVIVAVGIGAGWLWLRSRRVPEQALSVTSDSVALAPAPSQPFVLPSLGASDAAVRALVSGVSSHPRLASWLVTDDLVRRFVEAVVDISRGTSPVATLEVLIPEEPFSVQTSGDGLVMAPRSQQRYDLLGEVFAGVDAQTAAETYRQLLPLFREAYRELGVQDGEFEEVLDRAIGNLLAVEVPEGPLELGEAVGRYVYLDPTIESLTPAQKHMFRLGPANARRVQGKLREISERLDLPVENSPV